MSELTQCNYCNLRDIRRRAKSQGKIVTVKTYTKDPTWKAVFVHKKGEELVEDMENGNCVSLMLEIGDHCEC